MMRKPHLRPSLTTAKKAEALQAKIDGFQKKIQELSAEEFVLIFETRHYRQRCDGLPRPPLRVLAEKLENTNHVPPSLHGLGRAALNSGTESIVQSDDPPDAVGFGLRHR